MPPSRDARYDRALRAIIVIGTALALWWAEGEAAQLQLTWIDNASNEAGFSVERRNGTTPFTQVAVVGPNSTSYADSGLTPGVSYCYRVQAFNAAGVSAYSNEACATATTTGVTEARIFTGAGPGGGPHVQGFTSAGLPTTPSFFAYDATFTGGLYVAGATLSGSTAIVTGAGTGGGPHIQAFHMSGTGTGVSFSAYDTAFLGGARVAACDVDGDGVPEIITGAGPGGGPHVRVWKVNGRAASVLTEFFAYNPGFHGGTFVACGDVDGDGHGEIITAPGAGGGPHIRVWRVVGSAVSEVSGFLAYDPAFTGGVFVAAGDLDNNGRAEIITGAGAGSGPHVRVWRIGAGGTPTEVVGFFAYLPSFAGGVRVGTANLDGNGRAAIITGAGPGGAPHVRAFRLQGSTVVAGVSFFAYTPTFPGGVFVSGAP